MEDELLGGVELSEDLPTDEQKEHQMRVDVYGEILAEAKISVYADNTISVTLDRGLPRKNSIVVITDRAEASAYILDNVAAGILKGIGAFDFMKK